MKMLSTLMVIFLSLCYYFIKIEISYKYSDLKTFFDSLQVISSMIFTIMGIWIAFVYPNALHRLTDPGTVENADFSEFRSETTRLENLVKTVMYSALVLTAIMVFYGIKPILSGFDFYDQQLPKLKSISLSFAITLGALQFQAIYNVVKSNVMFINELHSRREEKEADSDI